MGARANDDLLHAKRCPARLQRQSMLKTSLIPRIHLPCLVQDSQRVQSFFLDAKLLFLVLLHKRRKSKDLTSTPMLRVLHLHALLLVRSVHSIFGLGSGPSGGNQWTSQWTKQVQEATRSKGHRY